MSSGGDHLYKAGGGSYPELRGAARDRCKDSVNLLTSHIKVCVGVHVCVWVCVCGCVCDREIITILGKKQIFKGLCDSKISKIKSIVLERQELNFGSIIY